MQARGNARWWIQMSGPVTSTGATTKEASMATLVKIVCIGCVIVGGIFGTASYLITEAQAAMISQGAHK